MRKLTMAGWWLFSAGVLGSCGWSVLETPRADCQGWQGGLRAWHREYIVAVATLERRVDGRFVEVDVSKYEGWLPTGANNLAGLWTRSPNEGTHRVSLQVTSYRRGPGGDAGAEPLRAQSTTFGLSSCAAPAYALHTRKLHFNTSASGADLKMEVSDFPVLLRLDQTSFVFSEAQPHGEDVRFYAVDGSPLAHEIEAWDQAQQRAAVWIRVPKLAAQRSDEYVWMHWGDSRTPRQSSGAATFTPARAVYHLSDQDSTAAIRDARGIRPGELERRGRPVAVNAHESEGIVAGALTLSGGTVVNVGDALTPKSDAWSVSLWAKNDSAQLDATQTLLGGLGGRGHLSIDAQGHVFWALGTGTKLVAGRSREPVMQLDTWHHYTLVFERGAARIWLDGRELASQRVKAAAPSPRSDGYLGGVGPHGTWQGALDEVVIMPRALSADWIHLSYQSQQLIPSLAALGTVPLADSDADRVPDVVERALGHDLSAGRIPRVARPSAWLSDAAHDQPLIYDTPYGTRVLFEIPAGTMKSELNPIFELLSELADPPVLQAPDRIEARYRMAGELQAGVSLRVPLFVPLAQPLTPARFSPACFAVYYRADPSADWQPLEVLAATAEAVYVQPEVLAGEYVLTYNSERLVFVNDDVSSGDGSSWDRAYADLQDALARARTLLETTATNLYIEIWVAEGTYKPGPAGANTSRFDLPGRVRVYGGFRGDGTGLRDPALYPTVLSGDLNANGATDPEDAEHVLWHIRPHEGKMWVRTRLDGFIVEHGYAADAETPNGGGLFIGSYYGGLSLALANMVFRDNFAAVGGAMYVDHNSPYGDLLIYDSKFENNHSELAGGALALVAHNAAVYTVIDGVQFLGNRTAVSAVGATFEGGGAVFSDNYNVFPDSAYLQLSRCVFSENWSDSTGGALRTRNSPALLAYDVFHNNWARTRKVGSEGGGGAIHTTDGLLETFGSTFADNYASLVDANTADVILGDAGTYTIRDSIFYSPKTVYNPPWPRLIRQSAGRLTLSHSYVEGGVGRTLGNVFDGGGNLGDDPEAVPPGLADLEQAAGPDGLFATRDDGLRLLDVNSACVGAGSSTPTADERDILLQTWRSEQPLDVGAYWVTRSPYDGVDFLASATQSFGFDRVEASVTSQPDPSEIYLCAATQSTNSVDVVVEDVAAQLSLSSADPSLVTILGATNNRLPLTRNVQRVELAFAGSSTVPHTPSQLEVRDASNTLLRALNAEVYAPVVVPALNYYRVFDSTSPRAAQTLPSVNPPLELIRLGANELLRQTVVSINSVVGSEGVDLPYDVNGNGLVDFYPGAADSTVELGVLVDAGLPGDAKIAVVGGARAAYRLTAPLPAGATQAELETIEGIAEGGYLLGPENSDGNPDTADGDETLWIYSPAIRDGVPSVRFPTGGEPQLSHAVGEVLYLSLAGLSTDPQIIASTPYMLQVVAHELLHRGEHPRLGNLLDVYATDNLMTAAVRPEGRALRFRRQQVVYTGTYQLTGATENQWHKSHYIGYAQLTMQRYGSGQVSPYTSVLEENVPLTISAVPDPGYRFATWVVSAGQLSFVDPMGPERAVTNILLTGGDVTLAAVFEAL